MVFTEAHRKADHFFCAVREQLSFLSAHTDSYCSQLPQPRLLLLRQQLCVALLLHFDRIGLRYTHEKDCLQTASATSFRWQSKQQKCCLRQIHRKVKQTDTQLLLQSVARERTDTTLVGVALQRKTQVLKMWSWKYKFRKMKIPTATCKVCSASISRILAQDSVLVNTIRSEKRDWDTQILSPPYLLYWTPPKSEAQ